MSSQDEEEPLDEAELREHLAGPEWRPVIASPFRDLGATAATPATVTYDMQFQEYMP